MLFLSRILSSLNSNVSMDNNTILQKLNSAPGSKFCKLAVQIHIEGEGLILEERSHIYPSDIGMGRILKVA